MVKETRTAALERRREGIANNTGFGGSSRSRKDTSGLRNRGSYPMSSFLHHIGPIEPQLNPEAFLRYVMHRLQAPKLASVLKWCARHSRFRPMLEREPVATSHDATKL